MKNDICTSFVSFKNRSPTLGFWNLPVISFQIILATFQKNLLGANETGKCWRETKVVKVSQNLIFNHFLYMMEQKKSKLKSSWNLLSNYFDAIFQKKTQLGASEIGKFWREKK